MMHTCVRGSGYPILFLHGMPTSSALWNGVMGRLSDRFQCIAVDLPGLGKTAATPQGFRDPAALAGALEETRIAHGIEKWHIVGHDAGCAIAVHYVHQFPNCVAGVSLLTPSLFPDLKPFYLFELLRKPVFGELLAPAVNLLFWKLVMRMCLDGDPERKSILRDFRRPFTGLRGCWRLMAVLRWGKPSEVLAAAPELLPQIVAPTLIVHGLKDPAVPVTFARRASELMPNAELMLLDCGHFVPLSEPTIVASALARFLGNIGSSRRPPPLPLNRPDGFRRS